MGIEIKENFELLEKSFTDRIVFLRAERERLIAETTETEHKIISCEEDLIKLHKLLPNIGVYY